jgi:hypothetical protein
MATTTNLLLGSPPGVEAEKFKLLKSLKYNFNAK